MDIKIESRPANENAGEAIEIGKRSIEAVAELTQRNMVVMLDVAQATTQGIQAIVSDMATFSKQSLERASATTRDMTTATTPSDIAKLQAQFVWAQFDAARVQLMKLSDAMFHTAREQLAAQAALAQREMEPTAAIKPNRR